MEKLSKDILQLIALKLDLEEIEKLCKISKTYNEKVYKNNNFWSNKVKKDFDIDMVKEGAKQYYSEIDNLLKNNNSLFDIFNIALEKNRLDLVKIIVNKGFLRFYTAEEILIDSIYNDEIFDYLLEIFSKETSLKILVGFVRIFNNELNSKKEKLVIIIFDKILPKVIEYHKLTKEHWNSIISKMEEFKDYDCFKETYNKRIDLYKKLKEYI